MLMFQYGSNCNERRLNCASRLGGMAHDLGLAETTETYDLAFDVWSKTNGCAAGDLVHPESSGRRVWGVLYEIPDPGFETLCRIEGPRYEPQPISVRDQQDVSQEARTFLAKPADRAIGLWTSAMYVEHIVSGLRTHGAPDPYIDYIIDRAVSTNQVAKEEDGRRQIRDLIALRT